MYCDRLIVPRDADLVIYVSGIHGEPYIFPTILFQVSPGIRLGSKWYRRFAFHSSHKDVFTTTLACG